MSAAQKDLQRELFDAADEQALSVCRVSDVLGKKGRISYLALVQAPSPNASVHLVQVKQYEKGVFKRKRQWPIEEIKSVDGRSVADNSELDIHTDKLYRWTAANPHERQHLVVILHNKLKRIGLVNSDTFQNIPPAWLRDPTQDAGSNLLNGGPPMDVPDVPDEDIEDFRALTEREEVHLNRLLHETGFTLKNTERFLEELMDQLVDMDGANVQSILASDVQVTALMAQIETAIVEADRIEQRLDSYDEVLCHIRDSIEKMGEKNALIGIGNANNQKLLAELELLVQQLDLPYEYQKALTDPDLNSQAGLDTAVVAARALQVCVRGNIDGDLMRLTAVQDQLKRLDKWKLKFAQVVSRHMNNLFIHLGNDGTRTSESSQVLAIAKHTAVHRELAPFTELMHWLKTMDRKSFDKLAKIYTTSLCKIYERDIQQFFGAARAIANMDDLNTSVESGGKPQSKNPQANYGMIGVQRDLWPAGMDTDERRKLDNLLEQVLGDLEPVALSEQQFCINFFQMDSALAQSKSNDALNALAESSAEATRSDKQISQEVRQMMTELFGCLELELTSFIQGFEKLDRFYSMYVLVRLSQHVMSAQDSRSFLSMTFATALVQVKRSFDRFMQAQCQSIRDAKVPKRSRCGLLPYVENFEEFARTAEAIFGKSERRVDLDKWYLKMLDAILEMVPVHAVEHAKTPRQVVSMENFHHMHSQLARLKVPALDAYKKSTKGRYNEALAAYVTKYFGRPLEKLNLFFEGVQQKVQQGVKETEISYQMAYSKQELRKVIAQYPAREVKKGLESLYRKVEKHLCEEENLLQVVWRAMQEEFIQQYNCLEELIQRCYAGAMISMEFNIQDILEFFSEIARSH